MDERRQTLGMTWAEVASEAKITVETLRAIRRGKNDPSDLTKRGLDRALQWQPGGVQRTLDGGEPRPIDSPTPPTGTRGPAEAEGEESPIAAQLQTLLAQAQQRTEEKIKELVNQKFEEQNELLTRQNELIEKLLNERKGA